jgi:hypothetical protein
MLTREAFREGIDRMELRFDRRLKSGALDEYYDYLKMKLTDRQYIAASRVLFAESIRYPRPVDFVENSPPSEAEYQGERDHNPYEPVKLYVKQGSEAHMQYLRIWAERDRSGIEVPTESRDGYPAPTVVVLVPEEWEAQMSQQKMGVI